VSSARAVRAVRAVLGVCSASAIAAALLIATGSAGAGAGEPAGDARSAEDARSARDARRARREERAASYRELRQRLEAERRVLAEAHAATVARATSTPDDRADVEARAAAAFTSALAGEILPRWLGVPWARGAGVGQPDDFAVARPVALGAGVAAEAPAPAVNCGSFVVAALEGAGLRFAHPAELARAPALRILESVAPDLGAAERGIARWQGTIPALERELVRRGPGVYLLGLAQHIGFAVVSRGPDGSGAARLVHASRTAGRVVDEPMVTSAALLRSRGAPIFAVRLGDEDLIQRWLAGALLGPR
jgi:hypothetical protein